MTSTDGHRVPVRPGRRVGSATVADCDGSASGGSDEHLELFEVRGLPAGRYLYAQPDVGLMEVTHDPETVH